MVHLPQIWKDLDKTRLRLKGTKHDLLCSLEKKTTTSSHLSYNMRSHIPDVRRTGSLWRMKYALLSLL